MPTAILEKRKFQRNLVIIFVILIAVTAFILRQNFSPDVNTGSIEVVQDFAFQKIEINFDILNNPIFKELQPFQAIEPLEIVPGSDDVFQEGRSFGGNSGRDNPFLTY